MKNAGIFLIFVAGMNFMGFIASIFETEYTNSFISIFITLACFIWGYLSLKDKIR